MTRTHQAGTITAAAAQESTTWTTKACAVTSTANPVAAPLAAALVPTAQLPTFRP
jgi:hypothetical protein